MPLEYFKKLVNDIHEHGVSVNLAVTFNCDDDDESAEAQLEFNFDREETEEEKYAREYNEKAQARNQEIHDRMIYERLKKRFE